MAEELKPEDQAPQAPPAPPAFIPAEEQMGGFGKEFAASDEEVREVAKLMQKFLTGKGFHMKDGTPAPFAEALVDQGELVLPHGVEETSVRVFRAIKRQEYGILELKALGVPYKLPDGAKRIYSLEVTLVCDAVRDQDFEIKDSAEPGKQP